MKICFAASEAAPFAKTGGLADVAGSLPRRLSRAGHDVRLFLPLYGVIDRAAFPLHPVEFLRDVPVQIGSSHYVFTAMTTAAPGGDATGIYLIDCPALYGRPAIYTQDPDEPERFALLSRAVIECCQRMAWSPDVFHCNDWHTALVPFLLRTIYDWDNLFRPSRTLLTVHNLGYQGGFPADVVDRLGLRQWAHLLDQQDLAAGRVGFLRTGLLYTHVISTVSPTYAAEIQTSDYGMGLEDLLGARRDSLIGILNGVDYEEWDPARDALIPHRYGPDDLVGKGRNKAHLLASLGLDPAPAAPLVGLISRMTYQKGPDLALEVLTEVLGAADVRLVAVGSGETRYEEGFERLQQRFPRRVCYHRGFHNELAHVVEAAADLLVMPSRYEPCGLNQMFSLKYGTVPIVRRTGGLADSVRPFDPATGEGTGFVFEHFSAEGLRWALGRALETYRDRPRWERLMRNAMAQDFSWERQAQRYIELYARMTGRNA